MGVCIIIFSTYFHINIPFQLPIFLTFQKPKDSRTQGTPYFFTPWGIIQVSDSNCVFATDVCQYLYLLTYRT